MLIPSCMGRYREKKAVAVAIESTNEGKKAVEVKDDWVLIDSQPDFDFEKEWARFVECESTREFVEAEVNDPDYVEKFEKFWACYLEFCCDVVDVAKEEGMDDREIFEKFQELLDDLDRDQKGAADNQGRIEKGATCTLSRQKEMDNFSKFLKQVEEKRAELKRQHYEEEVKLEKVAEERNKLLKQLEERRAELKWQHYEEEVKLEKEFAEKLARFEEKYNHIN